MIMMKNCSTILTYEGSLDHKKHTSWKELEWWKILAGDPGWLSLFRPLRKKRKTYTSHMRFMMMNVQTLSEVEI